MTAPTKFTVPFLAALLCFLSPAQAADHPGALPRLKVSENHRFLVTAEGRPFFWLGDTAQRYPAPGEPLFTQR